MKDYDLYIRLRSANAPNAVSDFWSWLEEWLKEHFGIYAKTMAIHRGIWPASDTTYDGEVQIYSVSGEADRARRLFARLKLQMKERGLDEPLILEKGPPKPLGE